MTDQIPVASVTAVNTQLSSVSLLVEIPALSSIGLDVNYLTGFTFDDRANANPEEENFVDNSLLRLILLCSKLYDR